MAGFLATLITRFTPTAIRKLHLRDPVFLNFLLPLESRSIARTVDSRISVKTSKNWPPAFFKVSTPRAQPPSGDVYTRVSTTYYVPRQPRVLRFPRQLHERRRVGHHVDFRVGARRSEIHGRRYAATVALNAGDGATRDDRDATGGVEGLVRDEEVADAESGGRGGQVDSGRRQRQVRPRFPVRVRLRCCFARHHVASLKAVAAMLYGRTTAGVMRACVCTYTYVRVSGCRARAPGHRSVPMRALLAPPLPDVTNRYCCWCCCCCCCWRRVSLLIARGRCVRGSYDG